MEGYKIPKYQAEVLMKQSREGSSAIRYYPVQDKDGNYFIFGKEHQHCGLGVKAEFVPPLLEEPLEEPLRR